MKLVVSFAGFVIANFLFGAGLMSVKYSMITDLLEKKKTSLSNGFKNSGKFMVRVPPDTHRLLSIQAAESGVSLNRLISSKLG